MTRYVLALDPSLSCTGWIVLFPGVLPMPLACGVVRTEPPKRKGKVRAMDAGCHRSDQIVQQLRHLHEEWEFGAVVAEGPAGSKSVTAAKALERAATAWQAWALLSSIPRVMVTAHDAKKAMTGTAQAGKADMVHAFENHTWFKCKDVAGYRDLNKASREAVADAFGVALAAWQDDLVIALRSLTKYEGEAAHV